MKKLLKSLKVAALAIFAVVTVAYAATYNIVTWTGTGSRRNTVEFVIQASAPGSAASLLPGTDDTNALGSSSYRFSDIRTMDLTVSDDLTVTDDVSADNIVVTTATFNVRLNSAPRTNVTPSRAGELVFNTTAAELCMSTGSSVASWVKVSTPSAACSN